MIKLTCVCLVLALSGCAIGQTLEAVSNIQLSDCINECNDTEVDGCLDSVTENSCFNNLEDCFDSVEACNDYCITCEEEGDCPIAGECYANCNTLANSCTDYIDECAESLVDNAQEALVDQCLSPLIDCVAVCIEEVEDSLK